MGAILASEDKTLKETRTAIPKIAEEFDTEKLRLENTRRALMNILQDSNTEKLKLQGTQRAVLNILQDSNDEKLKLQGAQRALMNILRDFNDEKLKLQGTQRAVLNILQDSNDEKLKLRDTQRAVVNILEDLNSSNEELKRAHDVLEARVAERTSELEQSLREKEVLLKEIHHRVKNNLQIIHSMLNLQLPQVTDRKAVELFKESQNRVYSMALIHERLYHSESMAKVDFPEYIRSLVSYLFISYGISGNTIRPVISVEDVSLDIDSAIPCALIINELVSNSLKHAFPASRHLSADGRVEVSLRRDADRLLLAVSDNGVGLPQNFEIEKSQSLGLKLVNVLVGQLRGTLDIVSSDGAKFVVSFAAENGEKS